MNNELVPLNRLARFSVLTRRALAFAVFIVGSLLKPVNSSSLLVMLFLVANVVYHPIEILPLKLTTPTLVKSAR